MKYTYLKNLRIYYKSKNTLASSSWNINWIDSCINKDDQNSDSSSKINDRYKMAKPLTRSYEIVFGKMNNFIVPNCTVFRFETQN